MVDFAAGFGDIAIGATLGLITLGAFNGADVRQSLGIDGGVTESDDYKNGVGAGLLGTFAVGKIFASEGAVSTQGKPVPVTVSRGKYPESAQHIEDAIANGQPQTLTINRGGAADRRLEAMRGVPRQAGKDRYEYPPAMFQEGGAGASVRYITPSDNRGAGACISAQCRGLPDQSKVKIVVTD